MMEHCEVPVSDFVFTATESIYWTTQLMYIPTVLTDVLPANAADPNVEIFSN